jgi:glycosyltransferase involved in cell wall biosynthesis
VGAPGDLRDRFKVRLDQRLLRPWILSSSEFTRRSVLERVPLLRRHPSATIHPGTPVPEAAPRALHAPRTLVSTSQVNPDKGHADVLQALAALRAEGLDFRYIVVGAGSAEQALQEQARGLGLADAVEWTGFVTDVPAHLARADVFVLPSLCEPLGIALEEAMAHGLAPVARRAGGVPEIWPPGLERYMVRPEDAVAGFREALGRLLRMEDQDLLALQAAVRAHAAATFSLEAKARELAEWLEGVVRETPHA